MNYEIKIAETGDHIIIKVHGILTAEIAMQYVRDSHRLGKEKNIHKYLVDLTEAPNELTTVANFDFADAKLDQNPDIDRSAIVAWLVAQDDHSHDFMETLTRNRGHNVKICRDMESCMEYLRLR